MDEVVHVIGQIALWYSNKVGNALGQSRNSLVSVLWAHRALTFPIKTTLSEIRHSYRRKKFVLNILDIILPLSFVMAMVQILDAHRAK